MLYHQATRRIGDGGQNKITHEFLVHLRQFIHAKMRERLQLELKKLVHIQLATQILLVEIVVFLAHKIGIHDAFLHQVFRPFIVGIAGD